MKLSQTSQFFRCILLISWYLLVKIYIKLLIFNMYSTHSFYISFHHTVSFLCLPLNFDHLHLLPVVEIEGIARLEGRESSNDGDSGHSPLDYTAAVNLHVGLHHKVYGSQGSRGLGKELPGFEEIRENFLVFFLEIVDDEDKK